MKIREMQSIQFPNCCTGSVLVNFGETQTNGMDFDATEMEEEKLKADVLGYINAHKVIGHAFISVVTNNEQKTANRVLRGLGFRSSVWMSKDLHPETQVRLWWYPLK